MRSLALVLIAATSPALACPPPPPGREVVANDKATIAPDGGLIARLDRNGYGQTGDRALAIHADGAPAELTREYIAWNLSVLRPKAGSKTLAVVHGGKVVSTHAIGAVPKLAAAPKLVRVTSTAPQPTGAPVARPMYPPTARITVELGSATPAETYALVIYKMEGTTPRGVAYGTPDAKRVLGYSTGGKQCYGGFESVIPGERIAVAWLDIHGRLSARSAVVTVAAAPPTP